MKDEKNIKNILKEVLANIEMENQRLTKEERQSLKKNLEKNIQYLKRKNGNDKIKIRKSRG